MSTAALASTGIAPATELVQTSLQDGGRLLLMIAMALFLSYVLFMLGAVLLSAVADRVRPTRSEPLDGLRSAPGQAAERHRISA